MLEKVFENKIKKLLKRKEKQAVLMLFFGWNYHRGILTFVCVLE